MKEKIKKMILAWLAPLLPFVLVGSLILVLIIGAAAVVFGPVSMAKDSSESSEETEESGGGFFEKFGNFLSGNGWTDDEKAFWNIIDDDLDCQKSTLVTATIMFYYQNNPNKMMEYGEDIEEQEIESADDVEDITENIGEDIPYGEMIPDVKRLVKNVKKGLNNYETYVKDTFLRSSPYNEMLEGAEDEDKKVDEIYEQIENIASTVECRTKSNYGSASCAFNVDSGTATDLKVRLLKCGNLDGDYSPIEGIELVDFEKYIAGVVYAENGAGPLEALKVQAVAARSYTLTRGLGMPDPIGTIERIDGQWVVSIRNCVADQVYCDPDDGCSSNNPYGGQYTEAPGIDGTVYPGQDSSRPYNRESIPEDSPIRTAVEETSGEVLINSDGDIINTGYASGQQNSWNSQANAGSDYYEILMRQYSSATDVASNCTLVNGNSSGEFANWKQYDPNWKNVALGNKTIGAIGCAATSVAIQIASSGTEVLIDNFNPGTFVQAMSANGGFSGNSIVWGVAQTIAPNFKFVESFRLSGTKSERANRLREEINKGNRYLIMSVKPGDGHWVAVNYIDGENVYMFDPGSPATLLWEKYTAALSFNNDVKIYEKTD
ncbi:MAG: SpoIID/LytB domain-containing protein [Bacilli bacterium]|nr:SpoIID/LytB domain-containing protein [Bacilli bacterium]